MAARSRASDTDPVDYSRIREPPAHPSRIPMLALIATVVIFLATASATAFVAWGSSAATLVTVTSTLNDLRKDVATKSDLAPIAVRIDRLEKRDDEGAKTDITVMSRLSGIEAKLDAIRYEMSRWEGRRAEIPSGGIGGMGRPNDR